MKLEKERFCLKPEKMKLKEFFIKELNGDEGRILDCATVNRHAYIAYELPDGTTTCLVAKIRRHIHDELNFSYKTMGEWVGPHAYDCPERILKQLSNPPPNPLAAKWRRRCQENVEKRPVGQKRPIKGDIVKFKNPLTFEDGRTYDTFLTGKRGSRTVFHVACQDENGNWQADEVVAYYIKAWTRKPYEIIARKS